VARGGTRPDAIRALSSAQGDRVLFIIPRRKTSSDRGSQPGSLPDPHDLDSKMLVADLRAMNACLADFP